MPRIYVACLASYNSGKLHGAWIDAAQDADDIRAEIAAMLRESPCPNVTVECPDCDGTGQQWESGHLLEEACPTCNGTGEVPSAEEYAIHDYEGFGEIKLSEYESIDTVSELASVLDDLDEDETDAFCAWYGREARDGDLIEAFREDYQGMFDDLADYAYRYCDDCGVVPSDLPDLIANHIDYEGMGRDFELGGDIWTHDAGYHKLHVFSNH